MNDYTELTLQSALEKALHEISQYFRGRGVILEQVGLPVPASIPTEI